MTDRTLIREFCEAKMEAEAKYPSDPWNYMRKCMR